MAKLTSSNNNVHFLRSNYLADMPSSCAVGRNCDSNNCDVNARCEGTPTGFNCICNDGYAGSGTICTGEWMEISPR